MNEFFSWEMLTSFVGMTLAVSLIVQFTKGIIKESTLPNWTIRLYALAIAIILQGVVVYMGGQFTPDILILAIVNSVLVALTAIGGYEVISNPTADK